MPKEWILNTAINRWGLQKKRMVGAVSNEIRKCSPKTINEVDFFIKVKDKYIGLQIKPAGYAFIPQIINERINQEQTHKKFTSKYGGKVFYVISVKEGDRKKIYNAEVIDEIREEIDRLKREQ